MNRLKATREERGLSQAQLAERAGVSVRMIQHYEQGFKDLERAQVRTVYRLAKALRTTVEKLIES